MNSQVLVLDANYSALGMVSMKKGINYILKEKGFALFESDLLIETDHLVMFAPSIVVLNEAKAHKKHQKGSKPLRWSKKGVLQRDKHRCAYCLGRGTTVDHIKPRKHGGGNEWLNTVASCQPCNSKKDCLALEESGMKLLIQPYVPTHMSQRLSVSDRQMIFLTENDLGFVLG